MSLAEQLDSVSEGFKQNAPEPVKSIILDARASHASTFDPSSTIQIGQKLPAFKLQNAIGEQVSSDALLQKGPLLIVFYRGSWCPFCNLTLGSLQKHLAQIEAKGVTLVAISPELPDTSLSAVEKHELKFPVLSDVNNELAEKLGIVYHQPDSMRTVFEKFGNDLKVRNGRDSLDVPIPTTMLVDQTGTVRNLFLDTDYTKRLEPIAALDWIDKL